MTPYSLKGNQIQPDAAQWLPPKFSLSVPLLEEIRESADVLIDSHPFPDDLSADIQELYELEKLRDDPSKVSSMIRGKERRPISRLLNIYPQPFGASYNKLRPPHTAAVTTGRELARWFEHETPGLAHHQALYVFFSTMTGFSPPKQAQIWATLNMAIYSSLLAAWYYKWEHPTTKLKPRPVEVDPDISVLYDISLLPDGSGDGGPIRNPDGFPGTPRHPSYPSGHSTIGGAASCVLTYYFPELKDDLDNLADNLGLARMWAGIHYRSDHEFGLALGAKIGQLVLSRIS